MISPSDVKINVVAEHVQAAGERRQAFAITVDASAVPIGEVRFAKLID